ncbi:hypothetical protein NTGZN8_100081 [Candidatus Nitrotoga fabula]|uniref:Uncharacterized protein n=1 Tax=Candidatus Nitrotoga fabula TaxID=2182327 RepID=A0A916FAZ3_9PROT|nr:hypothetical protein NTGZN8_100081 [Candidatus Nitrotoga fabula]
MEQARLNLNADHVTITKCIVMVGSTSPGIKMPNLRLARETGDREAGCFEPPLILPCNIFLKHKNGTCRTGIQT